jgi:serralysin
MGNDTYKLGKSNLIWDGGGIDTISASSAKAKVHLNLNDGSWSWVGKKTSSILGKGQSWLGHFTEIENAVGSKRSDVIVGNELDNTIKGGKGHDVITGGAGADRLHGGSGRDRFVFNSLDEIGTPERPDWIPDFGRGDRIDLRKLGLAFLGASDRNLLAESKTAGRFYYDTPAQELRFDADGNGTADHVIRVNIAEITAGMFLL